MAPVEPRYGKLTFSVCRRWHRVLKSGVAQSNPTSRSRLWTNPVRLAKRHAKQDFQRQTRLNGGVAELLVPTSLTAWRRSPNHVRIKPDRQRSAALQAVIVRRPIRDLILCRGPTAHAFSYHAGFIQ